MSNSSSPPGWYQDPTGQSEGRYWHGTSWTQMSNRGGETVNLPIEPAMAQQPPVPGTQVQPPVPPAAGSSSGGSSGGLVIALVIGVLLALAVFVAVDDDTTNDTPTPTTNGTAPAVTEAPAEDG